MSVADGAGKRSGLFEMFSWSQYTSGMVFCQIRLLFPANDSRIQIMKHKLIFLIFPAIILAGAGWFWAASKNKTEKIPIHENVAAPDTPKEKTGIGSEETPADFLVAGWIPYWRKNEGIAALEGNLENFTELDPFAFGVSLDGNLIDTAKIDEAPWPSLFVKARERGIKIVPTILWTNAAAMHKVLANPALSEKHIKAIIEMLEAHDFSGVDIDYEGKDAADKDNFSGFIKKLKDSLSAKGKTLSCTVEARTEDAPPPEFSGTRTMSWANDLSVLGENCDQVRVMAYDQVFQVYRDDTFETVGEEMSAPNADLRWVGEVIEYFLRYVPKGKLVLGIPTYGWEFSVSKTADGYRYTRIGSLNYPAAVEKAEKYNVSPVRTPGEELVFTYKTSKGENLITFEDVEAIRRKIELAGNFGLAGVSFFKLDGQGPPDFLTMLADDRD